MVERGKKSSAEYRAVQPRIRKFFQDKPSLAGFAASFNSYATIHSEKKALVVIIKGKEQYFKPDPNNKVFPLLSLDLHYEMVMQYCQIHWDVPEDVRSYFNAVVTLYLYGWLYYTFFTLASEPSFFAV